jgi:hypothetical protein
MKSNNNYVKKYMDQLHRPSTHVDRKRNALLDDDEDLKQGLQDYLEEQKSKEEELDD